MSEASEKDILVKCSVCGRSHNWPYCFCIRCGNAIGDVSEDVRTLIMALAERIEELEKRISEHR
jgi:uncharacterized OB-fold protein